MSSFGSVLESLFAGSDEDLPTVVAEAIQQHDPVVATQAQEAAVERFRRGGPGGAAIPRAVGALAPVIGAVTGAMFKLRGGSQTPPGPRGDSALRFWIEPGVRARVDRLWDHDGQPEHLATVIGPLVDFGRAAWKRTYDCERRCWLKRAWGWAPSENDLERLFWRPRLRQVLDSLAIEDPVDDVVAGRPVLRVGARHRPGGAAMLWPHWLPFGADRYELVFDTQFGFMLLLDAQLNGQSFASVRVINIVYGMTINEDVFHPDQPPASPSAAAP
jgi:hypothetical protein